MMITVEAAVQMAANFCLYDEVPGKRFPTKRCSDLLHEFRAQGFFIDIVGNNPYGRLARLRAVQYLLDEFVDDRIEICLTPREFEEAFLIDVRLRSRRIGEYDAEYWLETC